jgi:hypothetical protein
MDKIQEVTEKVIDLFDNHNLSVEEGILVIERLKTAIKMYRVIEQFEQHINLN